nr:SDR family oxidoreductase [Candidatus Protochlamydia phocaeensis]
MKITVIGGSGLIGAKLVKLLQSAGHEAIAASHSSGVDVTTGKGLKEVLKGSQVVVDVANSSSFDEKAAVEFFEKSNQNLSAAEKEAGVKHHVALSIVGTDRLANSGYFHAKYIQEQLIKASAIPYTIVQSTQFYEFLNSIAQSATTGNTVRLPPVLFQPIAADDIASIG